MAISDDKLKDVFIGDGSSNPLDKTELTNLRQYHKLFTKSEIYSDNKTNIFNSVYRYGLFNPYGSVLGAKEYVFFTKPDLAIYARNNDGSLILNDDKSIPGKFKLNAGLTNDFWQSLNANRKKIIENLQISYRGEDSSTVWSPFNYLLQNTLIGNLSIPSLAAPTIDTASNMYGVSISYRGSSEGSDDNPDFSLEFKDDKYLNVYHFFKAYEEYETLKHHGIIEPWRRYICNKIIHDQFSIYKFIVDEDMQTIIYYGKYYGVMPVSLPRDSFSTDDFASGISYSVDFKAGFYVDMRPYILNEFNTLMRQVFSRTALKKLEMFSNAAGATPGYDPNAREPQYRGDAHTDEQALINSRPAQAALVSKHTDQNDPRVRANPTGIVYRLNWFG